MRGLISVSVLVTSAVASWDEFRYLVNNKLLGVYNGDYAVAVDSAGEDNEDYEQVPYKVVEKFNGYEERTYPSVMYVCTEMTYDKPDDKDVMESDEWTLEKVLMWMSTKKSWKKKPENKMFMKLFKYISGVNKENQEIDMTIPVWSKMVVDTKDGKLTKDMCFYITKEFQSNPPEPIDPDVKIKKSKKRVVFVKRFGGYAMQDSVWMKEAEKFKEELSDRKNEVDFSYFWTAGYDSPMQLFNRTNEVAFNKVKVASRRTKRYRVKT